MNCRCHDLPAYWQKDRRLAKGGWWECPVKRRAHNRTRTTNPARQTPLTARARQKWHAPDGGYVQRRRITLASQRAQIVERLTALEQEANRLAQS